MSDVQWPDPGPQPRLKDLPGCQWYDCGRPTTKVLLSAHGGTLGCYCTSHAGRALSKAKKEVDLGIVRTPVAKKIRRIE